MYPKNQANKSKIQTKTFEINIILMLEILLITSCMDFQ